MKLDDSCSFGISVISYVIIDLLHVRLINKSELIFPSIMKLGAGFILALGSSFVLILFLTLHLGRDSFFSVFCYSICSYSESLQLHCMQNSVKGIQGIGNGGYSP